MTDPTRSGPPCDRIPGWSGPRRCQTRCSGSPTCRPSRRSHMTTAHCARWTTPSSPRCSRTSHARGGLRGARRHHVPVRARRRARRRRHRRHRPAEPLADLQWVEGAVPGAFSCWLMRRGLKTLPLRMRAHARGRGPRRRISHRHTRPSAAVNYPGLPGHPQHALARRTLEGFGGVVSFRVRGGRAAATVTAVRGCSPGPQRGCSGKPHPTPGLGIHARLRHVGPDACYGCPSAWSTRTT